MDNSGVLTPVIMFEQWQIKPSSQVTDMPCAHDRWIKKEERKKDERTHKHTITTIIQHTPPLTIPQSFNKRHAVRKKRLCL